MRTVDRLRLRVVVLPRLHTLVLNQHDNALLEAKQRRRESAERGRWRSTER
jgi:hypothetical protein